MTERDWWRGSVTYQIYPRSFQDDSGDGVGDLPGITRRLAHVADLGVDAVWISPVFPSPMADAGYDVSDHRDIDPVFGTLGDFDALVARAHELGLKVIVDQVLSHTSDRHPFFKESRASRDNPRADWYVWADAKPEGSPPSNWQAIFGGPAWEWDHRRRQYYFHNFLKEQPDLNFHNAEVQAWAIETLRFWLDRGVDGFRLDAVNHYFHDRTLRDNPPDMREKAGPDVRTYDMQYPLHSKNQPENVAFMERLRETLDAYDARVFVGEIGEAHHAAERLAEYTTGRRLHMAYTTELMGPTLTPGHVRRQIERAFVEMPGGWPCWAFSSHDVPRHVTRWAGLGLERDALARLCGALLLSLQGSVCLYQGEELGLPQAELAYGDLVDPEGLAFWPDNPGRDGCRTPMPWAAASPQAGFSPVRPWLPAVAAHAPLAADVQADDPGSVFAFYRRMIRLRRETPELRTGGTTFLQTADGLLAFLRGGAVLCAFNLSARPATTPLPGDVEALIARHATQTADGLRLGPGGFLVGRLV